MEEIIYKVCKAYKITKDSSEFYNSKQTVDGKMIYCKDCDQKRRKEYYYSHQKQISERGSNYYKANREALIGKAIIDYNKNKEKRLIQSRENYYKNKKRVMNYLNEYMKKRRRIDPAYRLKHLLVTQVRNLLYKEGKSKSVRTLELLGCSYEEFKQHIESQFTEGMSWDRRGEIHLDHIKPCVLFDLTQESEQRKCFHYTNYQPLWANENVNKGSLYEGKRHFTKDLQP